MLSDWELRARLGMEREGWGLRTAKHGSACLPLPSRGLSCTMVS